MFAQLELCNARGEFWFLHNSPRWWRWWLLRDVELHLGTGDQWQDVAPVSQSTALLLSDTPADRLRFVPDVGFTGTIDDAVTFRAWDQTTGTEGARADVTLNGEDTAFSLSTDTLTFAFTDVFWDGGGDE